MTGLQMLGAAGVTAFIIFALAMGARGINFKVLSRGLKEQSWTSNNVMGAVVLIYLVLTGIVSGGAIFNTPIPPVASLALGSAFVLLVMIYTNAIPAGLREMGRRTPSPVAESHDHRTSSGAAKTLIKNPMARGFLALAFFGLTVVINAHVTGYLTLERFGLS